MNKHFKFPDGSELGDVTTNSISFPPAFGVLNLQANVPVGQSVDVEWTNNPADGWLPVMDDDGITPLALDSTRLAAPIVAVSFLRLVPTGAGDFSATVTFMN